MKRRKQETITTYISTLTVNFGNNQPNKSIKSHSESHNTSSKQRHVRSSSPHLTDTSQSYRQEQQKSAGTYYQLIQSTPPTRRKDSEAQEFQKGHNNTSFSRGKAYFEELSTGSRDFRSKNSANEGFISRLDDGKQNEKSFQSGFGSTENIASSSSKRATRREVSSSKSYSPTSSKELSSRESKFTKTSAPSEVEPTSPRSSVSKEIETMITTTTTSSNKKQQTLSCVKSEMISAKPATDYGETDWYLDLLLRMQSLEMKQQNLHAQYDFLGKLATENREDLKQARDWARYSADNFEVQAY